MSLGMGFMPCLKFRSEYFFGLFLRGRVGSVVIRRYYFRTKDFIKHLVGEHAYFPPPDVVYLRYGYAFLLADGRCLAPHRSVILYLDT